MAKVFNVTPLELRPGANGEDFVRFWLEEYTPLGQKLGDRTMKLQRVTLTLTLAVLSSIALLVALALVAVAATPPGAGDPAKGKYIFAVNGGCGCHGPNLAGYKQGGPAELPASAPFGELFAGPFGSVPATNITPDKDTGVGNWTDDQLIHALRDGIDNGGEQLFPIMPSNTFHFMSDGDVQDLVAYLRTVPAVSNKVPERTLMGPVPPAPPLPPSPASSPTSGVERGKYLVTAVGDCSSCHTPTTPQGAPDQTKFLAGAAMPRAGGKFEIANNITPDKSTGIGSWTEQQVVALLKTGTLPDGTKTKGLMAEVLVGGMNQLTDADAQAIATYLKTIPPVSNVPEAPQPPQTLPKTGESPGASLGVVMAIAAAGLGLIGLGLRKLRG